MSLTDDSNHMIKFDFIDHLGNLQSYFSEQNDCGIVQQIYYTLDWTTLSLYPSSMTFYAIKNENSDKGEGPNCPNGNTPSTFPLNQEIIFTKI